MDSVKVFKGYGKVDNLEDQSPTTTTKSKTSLTTILTISSTLLLTLIIGASLLALIHESNTEEDDEPPLSAAKFNPAESIKLVCNVTRYPDSCFASISSLDASPKPDPESIFALSIKVSISELSALTSFVKTLTSDSSNPNGQKPGGSSAAALKDCTELFETAVGRLNDSAASMEVGEGERMLTERKISDIQTWVSAALTDQETCTDGLEEMESTALIEVKSKVQKCKEYVSNTLAIAANIHALLDKFGLALH